MSVLFDTSSDAANNSITSRQKTFAKLIMPTELLNNGSLIKDLEIDTPLLDYLVQNHAISDDTRSKILATPKKQLHARLAMLLRSLGYNPDAPDTEFSIQDNSLFVNALRASGNHTLASLLDGGRRISPDPYINSHDPFSSSFIPAGIPESNSGWGLCDPLSKPRRRGQLTLWLQVSGMKVCQRALQELVNCEQEEGGELRVKPLGSSGSGVAYWIDLAPPLRHEAIAKCIPDEKQQQHEIEKNEKISSPRERKQQKLTAKNCLRQFLHCWCLSAPKQKPNKAVNSFANCQSLAAPEAARLPRDDDDAKVDAFQSRDPSSAHLLRLLDCKSNELYQLLVNAKDPLHDALVKFLEQKIGILVLGSCLAKSSPQTAIALQIVTVATYEQSLRRMCGSRTVVDAESGKARQVLSLPHDLVDVFRQAGALDRLQVRDLRLAAGWSPQELQEALDELSR